MLRIEETPIEGSARTKTILSFRACGVDVVGVVDCAIEAGTIRTATAVKHRQEVRRDIEIPPGTRW
jgi:hypothetical protein